MPVVLPGVASRGGGGVWRGDAASSTSPSRSSMSLLASGSMVASRTLSLSSPGFGSTTAVAKASCRVARCVHLDSWRSRSSLEPSILLACSKTLWQEGAGNWRGWIRMRGDTTGGVQVNQRHLTVAPEHGADGCRRDDDLWPVCGASLGRGLALEWPLGEQAVVSRDVGGDVLCMAFLLGAWTRIPGAPCCVRTPRHGRPPGQRWRPRGYRPPPPIWRQGKRTSSVMSCPEGD